MGTSADAPTRRDARAHSSEVAGGWWPWAAVGIVLLAAALRLWDLGGPALWLDEAVYANNSRGSFAEVLEATRTRNSSPLTLPLVLWVVQSSVESSAWVVRLPSVVASVAAVAVVAMSSRVGVPRGVALLAAFLLAVAPVQVEYAQEVREYALSVLATAALLFASLAYLRGPAGTLGPAAVDRHRPGGPGASRRRRRAGLVAVLVVVPWLSYGAVLAALAVVTVLAGRAVWQRVAPGAGRAGHAADRAGHAADSAAGAPVGDAVAFGAALAASAGASFLTVARFQAEIRQASYLDDHYPATSELSLPAWLTTHLTEYFTFLLNGPWVAGLGVAALLAGAVGLSRQARASGRDAGASSTPSSPTGAHLLAVVVVLLGGSLAAAAIGAFPFGGIRQHLFAAPALALGAAAAGGVAMAGTNRALQGVAIATAAALAAAHGVAALPEVYGEKQDVVSAVEQGIPPGTPDDEVYVYYGAVPGIDFHYPDRGFVRGASERGDVPALADEAERAGASGRVVLVFAHVFSGEARALIAELRDRGWVLDEDLRFEGARVSHLHRPG
jgi:hypothetical protein